MFDYSTLFQESVVLGFLYTLSGALTAGVLTLLLSLQHPEIFIALGYVAGFAVAIEQVCDTLFATEP